MSKKTYTVEDIRTLLANLGNQIPEPDESALNRVKLPIPEEYGGGYATGKTMEEAVLRLIFKVRGSLLKNQKSILFSDCAKQWFALKKGQERSTSTIANYRRMLDKHILPFFRGKWVNQIKAADIQRYFNSIMKNSKSMSDQSKAILSGIFDYAARNDMIDKNPMQYKYEKSAKVGKKVVLQDEDLISVIDQLDNLEGKDYLYACFLCFTSLRRGEILGLKWGDIDLENRVIHVRRGVSYPDGQNDPVIDLPKDDSTGDVLLQSELARRLSNRTGGAYTYVIPYSDEEPRKPITRSMFTKMWRRINKTIDLKGATSHSFRATYATMMNAHCSHIDPKALQGALRHKTPDLAIKVYTKENDNKTRQAELEYDEWIQSQLKQASV